MRGKKNLLSNAFFLQELHLQGLWIPWRAPAGYHIRRDISLSIICSSICHIRRNVRMYIPHRFLPWGRGDCCLGRAISQIYMLQKIMAIVYWHEESKQRSFWMLTYFATVILVSHGFLLCIVHYALCIVCLKDSDLQSTKT